MATSAKELARKGRLGDTRIGHLSNGDRVFPVEHIGEHTAKQIDMFMRKHGLDPDRFTVGHKANRKNPHTRLPEFESSSESNGGGGNPGDNNGGGGGGGPSGPGDNSSTDAGHEASDVSSPGNNPTGVSGPGGTPGTPDAGSNVGNAASANNPNTTQGPAAPTAGQLAGAPAQSAPGISIDRAGALSSVANALGLGFLDDKVETLANLGFSFTGVPNAVGLANTLSGRLGTTSGQTTATPGQPSQGQATTTGPSFGGAVSAAASAIGDAVTGSGGLSGKGGVGPSPTGGAGGSEGGAGAPSIGNSLLAQATPQTSAPTAATSVASPAATPSLGAGIGLPLTDMLFNTYRL